MGCLVAADAGFGKMELTEVALPGTHDSGTFDLDTSLIDEQSGSGCTSYSPVYGSVRSLVQRWSQTQDLDYPQQLDAGVRYVDVRVAYTGSAATGWRIVHTLFSRDSLSADMASIAAWATAHPSEVVVVDFQHVCYDNSPGPAADQQLWAELAPLAPVAYDPSTGPRVPVATLDDIVGQRRNVVVVLPSSVLQPAELAARYGVQATFTVTPGSPAPAGAPAPTMPEEYAWPSAVGPTAVAGETAADRALAAYPGSITPALGSLAGDGLYQSQLIYSLGSSNEVAALTTFGGLITAEGGMPAWEQGLWTGPDDRDRIVAGWGHRLNVVVTDHVEVGGFVAAVVEQNAA
jgi:hypothetical protein